MVFDAPYNRQVSNPRLYAWRDWRSVIYPLLGKAETYITPVGSQESLSASIIRGRATSDALLAGYQIPTMNMPPTDRPIGLLKLHRDSSHGGSDGGHASTAAATRMLRSSSEVQRNVDLLQPDAEALSPEAIATILSGSLSLMNDGVDASETASLGDRNDKQDSLDQAAAQRQSAHRQKVNDTQRKMALDGDVNENDGLQIFRGAYEFWNRAMGRTTK